MPIILIILKCKNSAKFFDLKVQSAKEILTLEKTQENLGFLLAKSYLCSRKRINNDELWKQLLSPRHKYRYSIWYPASGRQ